jgi:uncharacterized protein (DUF924 family)
MYKEILKYWFGELNENGMPKEQKYDLWFGKSEETDKYLTDEYKDLLESAKRGELDDWKNEPDSLVALIVLLDQFSRNIYRDTSGMFAADSQALELAKLSLDFEIPTIYKVFTYMPFMHSEDLEEQNRCVELFEDLVDKTDGEAKESVKNNLDYAIQHRDIVEKYGRFPHRNEILGRESTSEELEYLAKPGAGF